MRCPCCMEEHENVTVSKTERAFYKDRWVYYDASYMYCTKDDTFYMDESQMRKNYYSMRNAYEKMITSKKEEQDEELECND